MVKRRQHGRKHIDTWTFKVRGVVTKAEVYLVKGKSTLFQPNASVHFEVEVPRIGETFQGKELDPLRDEIERELRKRLSITWERKLHVTVLGRRQDLDKIEPVSRSSFNASRGEWGEEEDADSYVCGEEVKTSLVVLVQAVLCGVDCDGEKVHQNRANYEDVRRGWPEEGEVKGEWLEKQDDLRGVAALVDDTPQNREALNRLFAEIQKVKDHLLKVMHPERLALTLAKEAGPLALPPPPESGTEKKPRKKGK